MSKRYNDKRDDQDRYRSRSASPDRYVRERSTLGESSRYSRDERSPANSRYRNEKSREGERDRDRDYDRERSTKKDKKKSKKSKKSKRYSSSEDSSDEDRNSKEESKYSNLNNPFNDMNLGAKFKWAKKEQKEAKSGYSSKERALRDKERREESKRELEKLNQRRAEREREFQLREQEELRLQREADNAQLGDWEAREEEFHLEQAKRRAEIRIRAHRAKPIDILAINVKMAFDQEDDFTWETVEEQEPINIQLEEPYTICDNLTLAEVDDLKQDIQLYLGLEKDKRNQEFWLNMMVVCQDVLNNLRANLAPSRARIPATVLDQINNMLSNKNVTELVDLEAKVIAKLKSNQPIDTDYWEQTLKSISVWKAKVKLRTHHEIVLAKRLEQLRSHQIVEAQQAQEDLAVALQFHTQEAIKDNGNGSVITSRDVNSKATVYDPSLSPILKPFNSVSKLERDLELLDPTDDWNKLLEQRRIVLQQIAKTGHSQKLKPLQNKEAVKVAPTQDFAAQLFRQKKEEFQSKKIVQDEDLEIDEEIFNLEVPLENQTQLAQSSQYVPRKPMYFNRVHTGYEWNKYNQTHYDPDNPPPKIVQGYKFHLFYPGLLVDPSTNKVPTPTYFLENDPMSEDCQLIRFTAGPPYQDVAFRIIRKEWEFSHKKGFKSAFINNTLYLYFHFKRHYYRR